MNKKRIFLVSVLIVFYALYFWTQSRYPQLNAKAAMGGEIETSGIGFNAEVKILAGASHRDRIYANTINWYVTNEKGMIFGVVFAGLLVSLFKMIAPIRTRSSFLNSLIGLVCGAPLGVCANCVTPIAKALYTGAGIETCLTVVFSSPTLNVVCLSLLFALFPTHFAIVKVIGSLVLILIVTPLLSRSFLSKEQSIQNKNLDSKPNMPYIKENWLMAIVHTLIFCVKNLFDITIKVVPWMAMAGLLGAVAIEFLPLHSFIGMKATWGGMVLLSLLGTFLPVPITFDIFVASALMTAGLDPAYVMVLLFTMGIFSIYPFVIIWQTISWRVAVSIYVAVAVMGIFAGCIIKPIDNFILRHNLKVFDDNLGVTDPLQEAVLAQKQCNALGNTELFDPCQAKAILLVAQFNSNPKVCDLLKKTDAIQRCKYDIYRWDRFDYTGLFREEYPGSEDNDRVQYTRAIGYNDLTMCRPIKNADIATLCKNNIILWMAESNLSPEICDHRLEGESLKRHCHDNVIIAQAANSSDIQICNTLDGTNLINSCKSHFVIDQVRKNLKEDREKHVISLITENRSANDHSAVNAGEKLSPKDLNPPIIVRPLPFYHDQHIDIQFFDHNPRSTTSGKQFSRIEGDEIGLVGDAWKAGEYWDPFAEGIGIASGDFNNDHYQDLVISTNHGIKLFKNIGNYRFVPVPLNIPEIDKLHTFLVAFVDINNDGWPDIFVSTFGGRDFFILNDKNEFKHPKVIELPRGHQFFTQSAAFADLTRDGSLDVYLGNSSWGARGIPETSENELYYNKNLLFQKGVLDEVPGETLSVLATDLFKDNRSDLWVGNDRIEPDHIYRNLGGKLVSLKNPQNLIPHTAYRVMSLDAADINNDLKMDFFETDMSFAPTVMPWDNYCSSIVNSYEKDQCERNLAIVRIAKKQDPDRCSVLGKEDKLWCLVSIFMGYVGREDDPGLCDKIPDYFSEYRDLCRDKIIYKDGSRPIYEAHPEDLEQVERNVLLMRTDKGQLVDKTNEFKISKSFWSWNSKFADLDNDGWEDLYIANGYQSYKKGNVEIHSSVFFHNENGKFFSTKQKEFGLENLLQTHSYTYVDLNNTGDIDIVTPTINGPIILFKNNEHKNNSITFEFRDKIGNSQGIGNKILIYYGQDDHLKQMREIRLSGGFMSFDAPVAHFGLADQNSVNKIVIQWSTGESSIIEANFLANRRYIINRS